MKVLPTLIVAPAVIASASWACAALWFDGPVSGLLAIGFAAAATGLLGWVRPVRTALACFAGLMVLVIAWWLAIEPSNDRDWLPEVAHPPRSPTRQRHRSRAISSRSETFETSTTGARWTSTSAGKSELTTCPDFEA